MKSKTILTQDDLLSNIMFDSRIDLLVVDVTDERKVQAKIKSIYGCEGQEQDGGIFVGGNDSINKTKYGFGDLVSVLEMLVGENGCP